MAKKQEILQELATWVAETVDIAKIIATHNKGLPQEDPAYVVPIDNKSASIKQKNTTIWCKSGCESKHKKRCCDGKNLGKDEC
mgnify:CR=1 FL=1